MKRNYCLSLVLLALFGTTSFAPVYASGAEGVQNSQSIQQTKKITGKVVDSAGEPIVGASVLVKEAGTGSVSDLDGKFTVEAAQGYTLMISFVGYRTTEIKVTNESFYLVTLSDDAQALNEVVVTAMGIKKDRKSLGYAVEDIDSEELMRNKSVNPINSLAGKIAGVNITQGGGAAGSGSQIILRGGTSLERDNQPLFVVDGVIYDNSTNILGNSAFDGSTSTASTNANRVMDINPEDIENMSVLKGPAAAALYGSKAAAGVVIITTKKGKEGAVEVNFSTKYTTQWATNLPKTQRKYGRGFVEDQYDAAGNYTGTTYNDFSYNSWGEPIAEGVPTYNNIDDFFKQGGAWDTNLSVAGGTKNSNFYLSGSYYNQDGIIPTTGYEKATFRFNGEQKWKMFTFGANVAYSQANTDKTLTSAGLYGSSGSGTMEGVYRWSPVDDMTHYMNEDGTRYRMFGDRLDVTEERDNPYWILNKNKLQDNTERFTGSFSVKADITDWWWISYRMGIDSYTTDDSKVIAAGGVYKLDWQKGMYSENSYRYKYLSTNLMTNFNKSFGDFNFNLMLGTSTDDTRTWSNYRMAWNFEVPGFYSFDNATNENRDFSSSRTQKRLVGVFGEFRADWKNTLFLTVSGRNDWSSTLPIENRSYFYPSVSGSFVFTELLPKSDWLSFGKVRASWARVGKDTSPYALETALWPSQSFLGGLTGVSNYWQAGNAALKPEITESTEIGLEMRFFNNRLRFDYAFYTNNSYNQIMSPRLSNATGYILRSVNAGDVYNKGMELSIGGTPILTKDWTWETTVNLSGNRGTVKNLMEGVEILYVTDVQVGNAKAASFPDGNFMAISGSEWKRDEQGRVVLDKNGLPTKGTNSNLEIGNREPTFSGGWNNTLSYKGWSLNMLWEFRVGGHVYNGTEYAMTLAGVSELSANRERIEVSGVNTNGEYVTNVFEADKTYMYNGKETSGKTIIANYYQDIYPNETANFMTKVNALRLRTLSLSYNLPKSWLLKTNVIKRAMITATANNILLFTNYNGDPEVAAAGSGAVGSSSVGIDYCGVPATASFSFGINLTF
ncbi:SusC/RagA family TonB-linked outer membrane protein [Mediterranea massiliensis]|uniref:SusC/RagA family TonB-linked outer membrane protein n=1 Tax=Mediterranea massiliensis TaxID=1841865 RepID=UPI0025A3D984|nr:SusC/RagA family TonB-linked outer membrane protein [Mediterranea massiliensis]MDM8337593.1 SusC/RagA family TonB-linked outer membrane protein [Mediterranea massiliensis]